MVNDPVTATFPAAEPEIMPSSVLKMTAVFAEAAVRPRVMEFASLKKKPPAPNSVRKAPKMVNRMMYVEATPTGIP